LDLGPQHGVVRAEILSAVTRVIDGGRYILGQEVEQLEQELAAYCGTSAAVGVASGTDAIALLLRAFDVGPGDEVITTPFTFIATAEAILHVGATPVFADVDPQTFLLTADAVEGRISAHTRAILVVHLFGQMADMAALRAVALRHDLRLFEDACQAVGALWQGRGIGAWGDGAALSFYPTKNLGAYGDGGMVVLNDPRRAERIRRLRAHGSSAARYEHAEVGWNSRLDELQAAILRVKLRRLEAWTRERIALADRYGELLGGMPLHLPHHPAGARHVYHLYTVRAPDRDALSRALLAAGVESRVYYPVPLHLQAALTFLGQRRGDLPVAERLSGEVLSLPLFPGLGGGAQDFIAGQVRRFFTG